MTNGGQMERTRKTWGEKHNIFQNSLCETSVLHLEPWKRCSWHRHQSKYNLFYVLEGKLIIKLEDGKAEVKPGQIFTTRPGEWHEFQTNEEPTAIIEVMFVEYDAADIEREKIGGDLDPPTELDFHGKCQNCGKDFTKTNVLTGDQEDLEFPDLELTHCEDCQ